MENFYFLFEDLENWDMWDAQGYSAGLLILITSTLLFLTTYYIILGRKSMRFSTVGKWFLFGIINFLFVFVITLLTEGLLVFELDFGSIYYEIWLFTIINAVYALLLYMLFSFLFKRFSIFSKFIPLKL